jgi:hypothetical protein
MATASSISKYCQDKITFYEGITDFSVSPVNDDILLDIVPAWDTVNSVANTPIVTFNSNNSGAATTTVVLRGVHTPELANDAATKAYVDGLAVSGVSWKNTVHAATTANISTFPPTDGTTTVSTLDGVTLVVGDRVLIKDQTAGVENGIYLVTAGTWTRTVDTPVGAEAAGFAVWVDAGSAAGDKGYVVTSDTGADVVGTHALVWANFSSSQGVAGNDGDIQINDNNGHSSVTDGTLNWHPTNDNLVIVGGSGSAIALDVSGGRITAQGGMLVTGGNVTVEDNIPLNFGSSFDFIIVHNTVNTTMENKVGDLIINNSNVTGNTVFQMGDAVGATELRFQDSAAADVWKMNSDGAITHTLGSYTLLDTIPLNVGTGSDLIISHDGTDSSIVNSTGALKIQQTASGSDLVVENTSVTAGDGIDFKLATATNGTSFNFIGDSAGGAATIMQILPVSEASTSLTSGSVRVTGGLSATGDISAVCFNTLSDATTKTNIQSLGMHDPLSKIKQIEGFNYNFLPGYGTTDRLNTGVLAQQLETIKGLEHCVTTDKSSGYKSVNYIFLIPMLIEAVKSLSAKLDEKQ